jgi:hypothetical protein
MAAIVEQAVCANLSRRKIVGNVHRHFRQAKFLSGEQPCVAAYDHAFAIHNDGLTPIKFPDRARNLVNRLLGNDPRVPRVRNDVSLTKR